VNDAAGDLLVSADRFEIGVFERRADDLAVDAVEIDFAAALVSLQPKWDQGRNKMISSIRLRLRPV
jgi:hypothetical protein